MKTLRKRYVIDSNGRKSGIIMPIKQYEELLEDLHDLAVVAERREEKRISFAQLKKQLKRDGLL